MPTPWPSGPATAQVLLLALSCLSASSIAGRIATSPTQTDAGISSAASSALTSALKPITTSITVPPSGFATVSTVASTADTDISLETATVDVNIDVEELAAPKDKYWRENCLLQHPTCVCNYQAKRTWYVENCATLIFFKSKCWNKPGLGHFCRKGEENGPPGIKFGPGKQEPKPKPKPKKDPKKHENCWIDGIPPDDCEAPEKHRGGPVLGMEYVEAETVEETEGGLAKRQSENGYP